jgi:hypothetical protein
MRGGCLMGGMGVWLNPFLKLDASPDLQRALDSLALTAKLRVFELIWGSLFVLCSLSLPTFHGFLIRSSRGQKLQGSMVERTHMSCTPKIKIPEMVQAETMY